jgi:ubiquinone/menaquinone biosynthesis C-methylase UbiE
MRDSGQVISSAAEVYDEFFLPALFAAWPPELISRARVGPGMRVVDVACGTGVLAIEAGKAIRPGGSVVGVDLNPGMLTVAREKDRTIDWQEASAEALPFDSEEFDAALCQFGLMFFHDRNAAVREMLRVLRPGGRLAIAVWDSLEKTPGYFAITQLLSRLFGDQIADLLRAPYALGDAEALSRQLIESGVQKPTVSRVAGEARFPSIRSWVHTDVRGWTLADKLDDEQFEHLVTAAEDELSDLVAADGSVRFEHPALIATAQKP